MPLEEDNIYMCQVMRYWATQTWIHDVLDHSITLYIYNKKTNKKSISHFVVSFGQLY